MILKIGRRRRGRRKREKYRKIKDIFRINFYIKKAMWFLNANRFVECDDKDRRERRKNGLTEANRTKKKKGKQSISSKKASLVRNSFGV